jgi:hypothetical protein
MTPDDIAKGLALSIYIAVTLYSFRHHFTKD